LLGHRRGMVGEIPAGAGDAGAVRPRRMHMDGSRRVNQTRAAWVLLVLRLAEQVIKRLLRTVEGALPGFDQPGQVRGNQRHGQPLVVRMNRPERLNALNLEMRTRLAETWTEFRRSNELEVAIFTGAGRAFCAGEDMKESLQRGQPGGTRPEIEDPFMTGALEKPVIAAVNGYAMGGGFMLVERTDLRVAAKGAVFEVSEAKRWLLGGYNHGHLANLPYPIAMEMALGFRFTVERFYEIGF